MTLARLSRNPFLRRELELRASGDPSYQLFAYNGPGLMLMLVLMPVVQGLSLATLGAAEGDESGLGVLFLVTVWMLGVYFSHAAARLSAGSLAIEVERGTVDALRLAPLPPADLLVGKYVASIAPLLVEVAACGGLLAPYALFGAVAWTTLALVMLLEGGVVLLCGMIGLYWSLHGRDVMSALSRAFGTVLALNTLPLVAAAFLKLAHDMSFPGVMQLSPLGLSTLLVHFEPLDGLGLLRDASTVGLLLLLWLCCTMLLYRASLRGLGRR